jgi:EAL domain-containing protein (putative c-di-GMP-specific phosphodiesterase class I)
MKYRLEPIVDLITGKVIGQELLAGAQYCPIWSEAEWRDWYAFLSKEIPLFLPDLQGLLFVNLSGRQMLDPHIDESIGSLRDFSDKIVIEWTEHFIDDEKTSGVDDKLKSLREMGFQIAIDDIGARSGTDGVGRFGAIGASFCKIDGAYFQKIRERGPEYLRDLCRHLSYGGAKVVVEWVETETDYRMALSAGAHLGQGYYWNDRRIKACAGGDADA